MHERVLSHQATGSTRYFFQKDLIFLENGKTGFFCFLRVGEAVSMLKVYYQFYIKVAWLTVLNYCTMCRTCRTTPTRQQRSESCGSQSSFNFFLLGLNVLILLLNWKYYLFYVAYFIQFHSLLHYFLLKMK